MNETVKIGKKGGAKRIVKELAKIRKSPLSKEVFEIVENSCKNKQTEKKSAKSGNDIGVLISAP